MGLLSKAAAGTSGFGDPASQGGLLKLVSQKQQRNDTDVPSGVSPVEDPNTEFSSPLEKAVIEKLAKSHAKYGAFRGIIIETRNSSDEFTGRLAFMISGFAAAQGLSSGRCLVLFDSSEDSELLGKHLAKTVPGNIIFSFEAKNPGEAFPQIKSYL